MIIFKFGQETTARKMVNKSFIYKLKTNTILKFDLMQ